MFAQVRTCVSCRVPGQVAASSRLVPGLPRQRPFPGLEVDFDLGSGRLSGFLAAVGHGDGCRDPSDGHYRLSALDLARFVSFATARIVFNYTISTASQPSCSDFCHRTQDSLSPLSLVVSTAAERWDASG